MDKQGGTYMVRYCPYCKCLILPNGKCRNSDCILGNKDQATTPQLELLYKLCEEQGIDTTGKDPYKLTKEKASKLIKKLIAKKALAEAYGSEVEEE
jgi:hypothetical protein